LVLITCMVFHLFFCLSKPDLLRVFVGVFSYCVADSLWIELAARYFHVLYRLRFI